MAPPFDRFEGLSIFDDKGEVKSMVDRIVQTLDPEVAIERIRKMDFSYIFILSKREGRKEIELLRSEIEASWRWRQGEIDETLQKKIEKAIMEL